MALFTNIIAAAAIAGIAAPSPAQYQYPAPVPHPAPGQPGYGYPQQQQQPGYGGPGYGQQQYGYQNGLGAVIGQLLGNRYSVTDRTAVQQCAAAAMSQASAEYGAQGSYGRRYGGDQASGRYRGYNQGYGQSFMRVTAITGVERRQRGLRVSGLIDSRNGYPPYGQAYGYQNQGFAATGDLSFRCNVDYRGAVTNVRVRQSGTYRR